MEPSKRGTTFVRLILTEAQQQQVREQTGRDSQAIELTAEELEERVVPKLSANHNESLVVEELEARVAPRMAANHNEVMLDP
jgi:hypothetical protein